MSRSLALMAMGLIAYTVAQSNPASTANITWQACPELNRNLSILLGIPATSPIDCANLEVPLDYTNEASEPLELSLFKLNATQEPVLGSVLINFGGPGGTGADNLYAAGSAFQNIIGNQWNLVSWDPRGTGKTIPFDCNLTSLALDSSTPTKRQTGNGIASANLTEVFLNGGWDIAGLTAQQCFDVANDVGPYISTAFTARDMIRIVDALGEDGLLRYYGWSYGTALGSYVSAMFPDRVERVVLDGNLDPYAYQSGNYGNHLVDADKAFQGFLQECLNNKANCSLAQYTNATTTDDMLDAINQQVQPFATAAGTSVEAFGSYLYLQQIPYAALYSPATWPTLADTITGLLNGSLVDLLTVPQPTTNSTVSPYSEGIDALTGIRALDAINRTDNATAYLPQVQFQETVSHFDSSWVGMWVSARWKIVAKEQYTGNFNVTTKHPILYVNGEYDPVTPLEDAYSGSQGFVGSVVLPHSGYGHGLLESPSECMNGYIQAYFANGTLPEAGARCDPDYTPWELAAIVASATESSNSSNSSSSPTPSEYTSGAVAQGVSSTFMAGSLTALMVLVQLL